MRATNSIVNLYRPSPEAMADRALKARVKDLSGATERDLDAVLAEMRPEIDAWRLSSDGQSYWQNPRSTPPFELVERLKAAALALRRQRRDSRTFSSWV
jgi:hypothetical protein